MAAPVLSVVVPTGRRRLLLATLRALGDQVDAPPFEVVVALDGADEEEAAGLATGMQPTIETRLVVQSRRGLQEARDLGASAARGEALLFIDDDHLADDQLLAAVWAHHEDGADVVQPRLTVHDGASPSVVTAFARRWAHTRADRLGGGPLSPTDLCASPLSIRAGAYAELRQRTGPPGYSRPGGAEDFRIGSALNAQGMRPSYLPAVACRSRGGETIADLLARSEEIGQADATLAARTPDQADSIRAARTARWVPLAREQKVVAAAPLRARAQSAAVGEELMAEARRGIVAPDSLARLDRALALCYWLGFGGDRPSPGGAGGRGPG